MASISFRSKSFYHVRSVSLPSCPHPLIPEVDEQLSRLRSSQSTSSSSLSSISNKLNILEEMYDSFDDFLKLSNTQQAFANNEKWVEEILDGYMRLLDLCANVKEISLDTKQDVQELLSVLRRREANEIGKYLTSRKNAKRGIQKTLKDLKQFKLTHKKNENEAFGSMFIDIEAASVEVFESLMSYIVGSKSHSKLSGLAAKKYFAKSVSFKAEVSNSNEFEQVDDGLEFLFSKKAEKIENKMAYENLEKQMTKMESNLQDLEEGFESLFRRLIKTRVALLNIRNNQS